MSSSGTSAALAAGGRVEVTMPQMGISVSEGTIVEWRKQPGDEVVADEVLCEVSTDKIDVEIPCPASGVLESVLVGEGETVAVGTPIALVLTGESNGEGAGTAGARERAAAGPGAGGSSAAPGPKGTGDRRPTTDDPGELDRSRFYSPVVQRMAAEHGIDLESIAGTGVGGRVRKKDVEAAIAARSAAPAHKTLHTESPYRPEPEAQAPAPSARPALAGERREVMTPMRKAIAEHMVRSRRTAAHVTTVVEVDFSAVRRRRAELRADLERRGVKLTYLAFVARAAVAALQEFPVLNASVDGEELVYHDSVNLGIAVALDDGLVVPVIPRAERLSLEGMAAAIAEVAEKARTGRLVPDDVQGGTFTITNPGQFGAIIATPIINQPQVAILDLEAVVKRPVVVDDAIAIRPMAYLPLSFDHRALDGATAARFLSRIKAILESGDVS
ncbi:MAG TPA: dihydrolipoamide acetyltransferase family protein [Solirubrobacterales bacterium]